MRRFTITIISFILLVFNNGCAQRFNQNIKPYAHNGFYTIHSFLSEADMFISQLQVDIQDGSQYNCDLSVTLDGYMLCYKMNEPLPVESYTIRFDLIDVSEEYAKYTVLLCSGADQFSIGEIRVFSDPISYSFIIQSNSCELEPVQFDWPSIQRIIKQEVEPQKVCVIRSYDKEKRVLFVSYAELSSSEEPYVVCSSIQEEQFSVSMENDSLLMIRNDVEMLVSSDRFFRFLDENNCYLYHQGQTDGIGFYIKCNDDNALIYFREIYAP